MSDAPSPDDLLQAAGLLTLGDAPTMEAVEVALDRLRDLLGHVSPLRHAVIRAGAVQALADAGVRSPARIVDAALEVEETDGPDPTSDRWMTHGPPVVDMVTSPEGLRYVIAQAGEGVGMVEMVDGRERWPASGLAWPAMPDAGAVLYALEAGAEAPVDELRQLLRERVVLPEPAGAWASLLAAWMLGTYLLHGLPYFPLLLLCGPPERGKTRLARAVTYPAYRGIVAVSTSPAMLARDRAWHRVTLALDVEDLPRTIERGDYLGDLLLASYESGGQVRRCVRPDAEPPDQADSLPAYGATIAITNEPIRDDSPLASRCIRVPMPEAGGRLVPDALSPEEALDLRARCVAWAAQLAADGVELPEVETAFRGRLRDLALPLLRVLALVAPSELEDVAGLLADVDADRRSEAGRSWEARTAVALWESRDRVEAGRLYVQDLADIANDGLGEDDPERLTPQQVGTARRNLGLRGGRGGSRGRAYVTWPGVEQARALRDRYISSAGDPSDALRVVRVLRDPHETGALSAEDPPEAPPQSPQPALSPENPCETRTTEDPEDPEGYPDPSGGDTPSPPPDLDLWTGGPEEPGLDDWDGEEGGAWDRLEWPGPDGDDDKDDDHRGGRRRPRPGTLTDGGGEAAEPEPGVDI